MCFDLLLIHIGRSELQKYPRTLQTPTDIHNMLLIEHIIGYYLNLRGMINFHNGQFNNLLIFFTSDLTRCEGYILFIAFDYNQIIVDEI